MTPDGTRRSSIVALGPASIPSAADRRRSLCGTRTLTRRVPIRSRAWAPTQTKRNADIEPPSRPRLRACLRFGRDRHLFPFSLDVSCRRQAAFRAGDDAHLRRRCRNDRSHRGTSQSPDRYGASQGRVIIIQQQCDIYMTCIEKVAEIVETARYDAKLIDEMRLSHKLAVVASGGGVPLRAGAGELAIRACRRCALGRGWSKWNDCRR